MPMATTVSDMLAAARAVVPAISPAEAIELVRAKDALIVDVRDGTDCAPAGSDAGGYGSARYR